MEKNKFENCSYRNFIWWNSGNSLRLENIMIKKIFIHYLSLARKLAKSDVLNIVSKFKKPPLAYKDFFSNTYLFLFLSSRKNKPQISSEGERAFQDLYNQWELLS